MSEAFHYAIPAAFIALAIIGIAEMILSARWNATYFTTGLPIFVRRVETMARVEELSVEALEQGSKSFAGPSMLFHRLTPHAIAFREKYSHSFFHYTPVMRGVIRRRESDAAISVIGFMNWWLVAFIILLLWIFKGDLHESIFLGAGLGAIYLIQFVRYARVAKRIADSASQR